MSASAAIHSPHAPRSTLGRLALAILCLFSSILGGCASGPPEWFLGDGVQMFDPFPEVDDVVMNPAAKEREERRIAAAEGLLPPGERTSNDIFADRVTVIVQREGRIVSMLAARLSLSDTQERQVRRMVASAENQHKQLATWYKKNKPAMAAAGWRLFESLRDSIKLALISEQKSAYRDLVRERVDVMERFSAARSERLAELRQMKRDERARKERERLGLPADGSDPLAAPVVPPDDKSPATPTPNEPGDLAPIENPK